MQAAFFLSIRGTKAIQIEFEKQGIDDATMISPLLLLPFVENAFKHGIQEEQNEGFVKILIIKTEYEIMMEVSNSIAAGKCATGGIGLVNVKKRLEILYPNRYELNFNNTDLVFNVNLILRTT